VRAVPEPMPRRRALLLLPLLAACAGEEAASPIAVLPPGPIEYKHLTQLPFKVAVVEVTPTVPVAAPDDIGARLRPTPLDAMRTMARDRLVAAGATGQASFTIGQAAMVQTAGTLHCLLGCRLDIFDAEGQPRGHVEAAARRSRSGAQPDRPETAALLLRETMDDLNVEFEFQIRRVLKDWLVQANPDGGAAPGLVEKEELPRS